MSTESNPLVSTKPGSLRPLALSAVAAATLFLVMHQGLVIAPEKAILAALLAWVINFGVALATASSRANALSAELSQAEASLEMARQAGLAARRASEASNTMSATMARRRAMERRSHEAPGVDVDMSEMIIEGEEERFNLIHGTGGDAEADGAAEEAGRAAADTSESHEGSAEKNPVPCLSPEESVANVKKLAIEATEAVQAVADKVKNYQNMVGELESKRYQLKSVRELADALVCVLNLEHLLDMIVESGLHLAKAKTGSIMLITPETNYMTIRTARGMREDIIKKVRVKIGEGISGYVAQTGEPLLIKDIENAGRFSKKSASKYETHSLISVPLKIKEKIIGVLNINNKVTGESFDEDDLSLTMMLASYAAISIDTARLHENLSKSVINIVKLATNALEAKDSYTAGHSERVTEFGTEIAKAIGCSENQVETIRQAGLLHDIGKIGINDSVLLKPSRLTDEEFEIIKTHPAIGYSIVSPMDIMPSVRDAILHHHERYDGRGYPDGMAAADISLEARILAVADSFDAMTSTRAYRKSLPNNVVVRELIRCSGSQFDPEVVTAFLEILKERQFYTDEDLEIIKEELKNDAKGGKR